jgi:hypothetical protein
MRRRTAAVVNNESDMAYRCAGAAVVGNLNFDRGKDALGTFGQGKVRSRSLPSAIVASILNVGNLSRCVDRNAWSTGAVVVSIWGSTHGRCLHIRARWGRTPGRLPAGRRPVGRETEWDGIRSIYAETLMWSSIVAVRSWPIGDMHRLPVRSGSSEGRWVLGLRG